MKLTNRTTPQAKNYQCNKCKEIKCNKNMYDDNICYDCYDEQNKKEKSLGGFWIKNDNKRNKQINFRCFERNKS